MMPRFSHSRIESFETCPLQYKYTYVDKVEVERAETVEAFLGTRVHEALEKLYTDVRHEKLTSLEELLEFFNRKWEENWDDTVLIVKEEYTDENYLRMGKRFIKDYYERYKPFNQGKILGLETHDYLPLDEEGKYTFHIRIDRLMDMRDGLYEVHDYKTSGKLPKQEELDNDRQLAMYSLWVRKQFRDFKKVRLVWHYLAFDREMDSFRTAEQLDGLRKEVLAKIAEVESAEEFQAKVSVLCEWCVYMQICPMWKHEKELEEKPENEYINDPGLKLVDEYVKVKKELDEHRMKAEEKLAKLKEALIAFSRREGISVVFGSENKITVKESEYIKFPAKNTEERKQLVEVLKTMDKWSDVSDLDIYTLARVLKSKEWNKEELEVLRKFGTKERSYKLTVGKK